MANKERSKEDVSIVFTNHYRHRVEFSVVSGGGLHEILRLHVEITGIHRCAPRPTAAEALFFRTNYTLTLVPTSKTYPLFPATTGSTDTWVLRGRDVDLFGVTFEWPAMMAIDLVIGAEVHDHAQGRTKSISSPTLKLQRNGEQPTGMSFVPDDAPLGLTPYLYKLITIDDFVDRADVKEAISLNESAYQEIATLFRCRTTAEFERLVTDQPRHDAMFLAEVHPMIAARLLDLAPKLRSGLDRATRLEPEPSVPEDGRVFIACARSDGVWLDRLTLQLRPLERVSLVDVWDDTRIEGRRDRRARISDAVERSAAAVLLIDAPFLASDLVTKYELLQSLAAARQRGLLVLPVLVAPCLFMEHEHLRDLQPVNPPGRELTRLASHQREEVFVSVAREILRRGASA